MTVTTSPRSMATSSNRPATSHVVNQQVWEAASGLGIPIPDLDVRPRGPRSHGG
jgi:hypothetical protein